MTSHLFLVLVCVTCASVSAHTLPSPQQPSLSDSSQGQLETLLYQLQTALEDEVSYIASYTRKQDCYFILQEEVEMQWWKRRLLCGPTMMFTFRERHEVQCCLGSQLLSTDMQGYG